MKQKKICVVVTILAVIWFCFIFYMSSQTAVSSGQMSNSITKAVVVAGERIGVLAAGTVNKAPVMKRYNVAIRKLAHVGMYFVLACVIFCALWLWGLNKSKSVIISLAIGILISIIDEINQMHFVGRNSGVISDGIEDFYRDTFGICVALVIFVIIRILIELRKKNSKV